MNETELGRAKKAAEIRDDISKMIYPRMGNHVASEIASAMKPLGCDELEVLRVMVVGLIPIAGQLHTAIVALLSRLLLGRAQYGELDLQMDPRNWNREIAEETADLLVYRAIAGVVAQRDGYMLQPFAPYPHEVLALGAASDVGRMALLVRDATHAPLESECVGSGLYFGPLSARVHNGEYTLHCHQCGATWPASAIPCVAGGEIEIPRHRKVPR